MSSLISSSNTVALVDLATALPTLHISVNGFTEPVSIFDAKCWVLGESEQILASDDLISSMVSINSRKNFLSAAMELGM